MFDIVNRAFPKLAHLVSVAACLTLAGCAVPAGESAPEAEETGSASQPIIDGTSVSSGSLLAKSTVAVWSFDHYDPITMKNWYNTCTGVIVGWRHVITAAHCKPVVGATIKFYNGPLPLASSYNRSVTNVDMRPGVNPWNDDLDDVDGKFADIALLTLDGGIPSTSLSAELPLSYPGNAVSGYEVGRGDHDGYDNPDEDLRYYVSQTYSSSNSDGHFLVDDPNVNHGDSGGPFYTYNSTTGRMRVHGVLWGTVFEWGMRAKYTSVEHHLSWLLEKMSYTGGMITDYGYDRPGTIYNAMLTTDFRRCALACAQDTTCKSYTQYDYGGLSSICYMRNNVPAKTPLALATSGAKWSL